LQFVGCDKFALAKAGTPLTDIISNQFLRGYPHQLEALIADLAQNSPSANDNPPAAERVAATQMRSEKWSVGMARFASKKDIPEPSRLRTEDSVYSPVTSLLVVQ
jgi:hypothetical protein